MRNKITLILLAIVLFSFSPDQTYIPKLGIIAPIEQDSLIYASGFRMLGESVSKMISPSLTEEQLAKNREQIKKARCKVSLCNIFFPGTMKIAGPNVDEQQVLTYAEAVFSRAEKAGVPWIILGSGGSRRLPDGYDQQKATADFIVLCRKLAIAAQKYKITIVLESLEIAETNFLLSLKSAADVVRGVNQPNFKLNADIFHMLRENESPQSIIDAGDILLYCEIAEKEKRSFPGVQGDDFKPYLRALKKANYKGNIFIEGRTNDPQKDMPKAFAYLTQQLNEVYAEK